MPSLQADPVDVLEVEAFLEKHDELSHLRVRKRGALLILESGPKGDAISHARLRRVTKQWWTPEIQSHTGQWSRIPERLPITQALQLLHAQTPWCLVPRE